MSTIFNYNESESLATGFVRPKVTSLFFDKIWIPESLVNSSSEYIIPHEVMVTEESELEITLPNSILAGNFFKRHSVINRSGFEDEHTAKLIKLMSSGDLFMTCHLANSPIESLDAEIDTNHTTYKYSKNRNYAIMKSAERFYSQHNVKISPVYFGLTDFEKEMNEMHKHTPAFSNRKAIAICIQDFPEIVEEKLSWEQVLDIRKDSLSIRQFKNFTTWASRISRGKSPLEIQELLEMKLDAYKRALKKHGVKTISGCFSTIVSGASSVVSALTDPRLLPLTSLALVVTSIDFWVNWHYSKQENCDNPIAYLYSVLNT